MSRYTTQQSTHCQHCATTGICLNQTKNQSGLAPSPAPRAHKVYHKSDCLVRAGATFDAIYILRSGSAKSTILASSGEEQITSFYYPGDLIGLDGFENSRHVNSVHFLETSSVCRINLQELDNAMASSPSIRFKILQGMSHILNDEDRFLLSINNMNSTQRFADFLLDLSAKFEKRGLSSDLFDLSMTRIDIANYLGMAIETVSRLLTQFQRECVLEVDRRRIRIIDSQKLKLYLTNQEPTAHLFTNKVTNNQGEQTQVV